MVYVLDLTPLIRTFPIHAQLGIDASLASEFNGVPLQSTQRPPFASGGVDEEAVYINELARNGSLPHPPTTWEAEVLRGKGDDYGPDESFWPPHVCDAETNESRPVCKSDGPLRWHRVHAVGNHLEWSAEGLRIAMAPVGDGSAVHVPDVMAAEVVGKLERSLG